MINKISLSIIISILILVPTQVNADPSDTDKLIGAIVGGAIGSTIGDGDGQRIATALGVLIGAKMADGERYEKRDFVRECRRNVPVKYRHNNGAKRAWIKGCVDNLEDIQVKLERQAYRDGLRSDQE